MRYIEEPSLMDKITEKLSERTFITHMAACVIGMLVCISSLTLSTWAFFSENVQSTANTIEAANYEIAVTITDSSGTAVLPASHDGTNYTYVLEKGQTYTVQLTASGTATTGYCKLTVNGTEYYTTQLKPKLQESDTGHTVTFTLNGTAAELTQQTVDVTLASRWGTYSGYSETATNLIGQSITEIIAKDKSA